MTTLTLSIDGMSCASFAGRAERALIATQGITEASVNLAAETARITYEDPETIDKVVSALADAGYPARTSEAILRIENMSCASCVGRVEKTLLQVPGVVEARVNLASETASVRYFDGQISIADITTASTAAGYPATSTETASSEDPSTRKAREAEQLKRMTLIAAVLTFPIFIVEMGGHIFPSIHSMIERTIGMQTSWVLQFILAGIVLVWPGAQFYRRGVPALLKGAPDMNSLVALGTGSAFLYSTIATFLPNLLPEGTRAIYFEAAAVIVVLILLGRTLEARAKGRTGAAIARLVGLRPKEARVERGGVVSVMAVEDIVVGDTVHLRPGEQVAVDGVVTSGASFIDESMISGEPVPVEKSNGAEVIGGTINGTGTLAVKATKVGRDTVLSQIIQMVEEAQGAKLPIQGLVDRITLWFVPAVMVAATLTALAWLMFGPSPALGLALVAGVSVLIIACPCAMGLATPTSIMVGTGRAAELGVLFRQGDALQSLQKTAVVALDKTGTLTEGRPELTDFIAVGELDESEALALLAGAESTSEHPIASAILRAAETRGIGIPKVEDFEAIVGFGISAKINGKHVLAGAERLMTREEIETPDVQEMAAKGRTPVFLAVDGKLAAVAGVADPIKESTPEAIKTLQDMGLTVAMITGDAQATAEAIAADLGITEIFAEVLPEGKVAAIEMLKQKGPVAFVGDGINDAPALAHADVGIAIGTGTDVAIETADVVLMSGDLSGVVKALSISRSTMNNIRQNLFWAFGYNVLLIPVAALGLLSPALAAGAMAMSSVFVLSNALRLRWAK